MVLYRKGRMSKLQKINEALKQAHSIDEAYSILDSSKFKLSFPEINQIVHSWQMEQNILKLHKEVPTCPNL